MGYITNEALMGSHKTFNPLRHSIHISSQISYFICLVDESFTYPRGQITAGQLLGYFAKTVEWKNIITMETVPGSPGGDQGDYQATPQYSNVI